MAYFGKSFAELKRGGVAVETTVSIMHCKWLPGNAVKLLWFPEPHGALSPPLSKIHYNMFLYMQYNTVLVVDVGTCGIIWRWWTDVFLDTLTLRNKTAWKDGNLISNYFFCPSDLRKFKSGSSECFFPLIGFKIWKKEIGLHSAYHKVRKIIRYTHFCLIRHQKGQTLSRWV